MAFHYILSYTTPPVRETLDSAHQNRMRGPFDFQGLHTYNGNQNLCYFFQNLFLKYWVKSKRTLSRVDGSRPLAVSSRFLIVDHDFDQLVFGTSNDGCVQCNQHFELIILMDQLPLFKNLKKIFNQDFKVFYI